jgi:hypothetical protein
VFHDQVPFVIEGNTIVMLWAQRWARRLTGSLPCPTLFYCFIMAPPLLHEELTMARKQKLDFSNIADARKKEGLNQLDFWTRYGVTQSGGSRYESGRNIPKPLAILLWLHRSGKVTDKVLAEALK